MRTSYQLNKRFGPTRRSLTVAVLIALVSSATATAGDLVYYAGGKAYTLAESGTEFGVLLEETGAEASVRDMTSARGIGSLQRLPGAKYDSRYRMLVAPSTSARARAGELPGVEWVRPVYRLGNSDSPLLATGQIIARLVPGLSEDEIASLFSDYGIQDAEPFDGLDDTYVIQVDGSVAGGEVSVAAALYLDDRTVYAHPNFAIRSGRRQVNPQDEFFRRQWHLQSTGQDGATVGVDINVLTAWEKTMGEDIRVGMLDDACDVDHEDLRNNYLNIGQDINAGDDDPRPAQFGDRHGTSVMGLICAVANSDGVRGVAPNARFTATRGLGFNTAAETASAYTFARQQNVDIHNNSWGYDFGVPAPDVVQDAIRTAYQDGRDGKGMVILFSSGNDGLESPDDISSLPTVLAIGATNAADARATYSNYGPHLDLMAPSNPGDEGFLLNMPSLVTTDNTDDAGYAEPGYNNDGFNDFGEPNLSNPDYTDDFGGTSGACPVAAGVAALILSTNTELTATQVRVVLEHTAVQVSAEDAAYDGITSRSDRYGYGRIDAGAAVEAASQSLTNGGLTWPDRVSDVRVTGNTLRWRNGDETKTVYIVQSDGIFQWTPEEAQTYDVGEQVVQNVFVVFKDAEGAEDFEFEPPEFGESYFAIFAQNNVGRFSWGVAVDSNGNVTDAGPVDAGDSGGGDDEAVLPVNDVPKVSIDVTPRSGTSPLTVEFQGNALTNSEIVHAQWDFGDGSPPVEQRDTTHTYTVTDGTTTSFIATFTVEDTEGDTGQRSIAIQVSSDEGAADPGDGGSSGSVEVVGTDSAGAAADTGVSPYTVEFTIDTADLPGVFNNVLWDLGDGTQADTVTVMHTYVNTSTAPATFAVQATVTTCHATLGCATEGNPSGTTWSFTSPVEFLTVEGSGFVPEEGAADDSGETGDGQSGSAGGSDSFDGAQPGEDIDASTLSTGGNASGGLCGIGMMPALLFAALSLMLRFRKVD